MLVRPKKKKKTLYVLFKNVSKELQVMFPLVYFIIHHKT